MTHKTIAIRIQDIIDGNQEELARCGNQPLSALDEAQAAEDALAHEAQALEAQKNAYKEQRRAEYPPIGDQLDAILKGLAALENVGQPLKDLQAQVLEIKKCYPKPA